MRRYGAAALSLLMAGDVLTGCGGSPSSPSSDVTQALVHSNTRWQVVSNGLNRFSGGIGIDYRFDVGPGHQCVSGRVTDTGTDIPGYYLELTVGRTKQRATTTEVFTVCGDGPVK